MLLGSGAEPATKSLSSLELLEVGWILVWTGIRPPPQQSAGSNISLLMKFVSQKKRKEKEQR